MFSSDLALEMLPLASVVVSLLLSCLILRIPVGEGVTFSTVVFVFSLFCLSPIVLAAVALNTIVRIPFLPELFSFEKIISWNEWYQIVSFEAAGNVGLELCYLLVFIFLSFSVAVWLTSAILGWRLPKGARFFSSVVLVSLVIFLVSISVFGRL